jgi:HAD superfamily hydrolase (TIGR01549 family)
MSIQPYPGVARMLQSLREQGYNLYIASNGTTKKQWDKIIRLRLAMFFDDVFVSEDVGSDKKDDFFQKVVIKGAFQPEECLMAGDREDADIIPAKKVGMFAARIMGRRHGSPETSADFALDNITELPPVLKRL